MPCSEFDETLVKVGILDATADYSPLPVDFTGAMPPPPPPPSAFLHHRPPPSYMLDAYAPPATYDTMPYYAGEFREAMLDAMRGPSGSGFSPTSPATTDPSDNGSLRSWSAVTSPLDPATKVMDPATDDDDSNEDTSGVDLSTLSKSELRKHKNRQSAARSRKRSRNRMEQLEQLVEELASQNRRLEEEVRVLKYQRQEHTALATGLLPPPPAGVVRHPMYFAPPAAHLPPAPHHPHL